jgi:hypothetical protein
MSDTEYFYPYIDKTDGKVKGLPPNTDFDGMAISNLRDQFQCSSLLQQSADTNTLRFKNEPKDESLLTRLWRLLFRR